MASLQDLTPQLPSRDALISKRSVVDPPGFVPTSSLGVVQPLVSTGAAVQHLDPRTKTRKEKALQQKAMEPLKQTGFMCFMLYMSGSSPSVFSIMMMVTCVTAPFMALANVTKAFPADKQVDVTLPRLMFVGIQLLQLGFAAWRLNSMGLLPTYPSDWMSQMPAPDFLEESVPPLQ